MQRGDQPLRVPEQAERVHRRRHDHVGARERPRRGVSVATNRVAADQKNRTFFSSPFELSYQRHSDSEWLPPLAKQLSAGDHVSRTPATFDLPKPNWHVRPGADLSVDDQVIYQYLEE